MDLSTKYLGLNLQNPLVMSASPMSDHLENFKKLEDAGIGAIVMHSVFEEQLSNEAFDLEYHLEEGTERFAESLSYFPRMQEYRLGPEDYLQQIERAKRTVKVPIIASLNGKTPGGWLDYSTKMESAGADALELNIYYIPTNPEVNSAEVEQNCIDILSLVKSKVKIPVAIKLSPYFSAMVDFSKRLEKAGADGIVLFNRFYQPDFDLESMEVVPRLFLSERQEMRLPLRWTAILRDEIKASLALTTGVYQGQDIVKAVMAGSDAVMVCSSVLVNGIGHVSTMLKDFELWMLNHEYESVSKMKGVLSLKKCASPEAFERANYLKILQSYHR